MTKRLLYFILLIFLLASCAPVTQAPLATETLTPLPTPTDTLTPTPVFTATPEFSPTPDLYYVYTNEYLRSRLYGGGKIEFLQTLEQNIYFTRHLIRYPSDGLYIYGFANIPHAEGPHPVIIALHGYIEPGIYQTLDYTTHYADALAYAGYIVLHPNLRGYAPSDAGENLFRVGMAVDVLNLIEIVKTQSGDSFLQYANPDRIGLWGHSMGGGISTRVLTVSSDVDAAVLYGAMSGDERKNYEAIYDWSGNARGLDELAIPVEELGRISSMYFFDHVTAAVSIHHGMSDELVPLDWSVLTCDQLTSLNKKVECVYYENMPHTFHGAGDNEFIQNTIRFFNHILLAP